MAQSEAAMKVNKIYLLSAQPVENI